MNIYKCSGKTKENNNKKMLLRTIKNVTLIRRCLSTTRNTNFNNNLLKTVVLSNVRQI